MASYADLVKTLREYFDLSSGGISGDAVAKNISEFSDELEDLDSDGLSSKYLEANNTRIRSVLKEFLDSNASIVRSIDSRNKERLDFMLEEANDQLACSFRFKVKNDLLGEIAGGNLGG